MIPQRWRSYETKQVLAKGILLSAAAGVLVLIVACLRALVLHSGWQPLLVSAGILLVLGAVFWALEQL